jgi:cell division septum initiation protein DivIVA
VPPRAEEKGPPPVRRQGSDGPTFDVVFKGYERASVDEYMTRLHEWLLDSEERAEKAAQAASDASREAEELRRRLNELEQRALTSPEAAGAVGERVAQILRAALETGEAARQHSEEEAAKLLQQAEQRSSDVLRAAERRAAQLRDAAESELTVAREKAEAMLQDAEAVVTSASEEARAEAGQLLEDARNEYQALQQGITELNAYKTNTLTELHRLQQYLAGAAGGAGAHRDGADQGPSGARTDAPEGAEHEGAGSRGQRRGDTPRNSGTRVAVPSA